MSLRYIRRVFDFFDKKVFVLFCLGSLLLTCAFPALLGPLTLGYTGALPFITAVAAYAITTGLQIAVEWYSHQYLLNIEERIQHSQKTTLVLLFLAALASFVALQGAGPFYNLLLKTAMFLYETFPVLLRYKIGLLRPLIVFSTTVFVPLLCYACSKTLLWLDKKYTPRRKKSFFSGVKSIDLAYAIAVIALALFIGMINGGSLSIFRYTLAQRCPSFLNLLSFFHQQYSLKVSLRLLSNVVFSLLTYCWLMLRGFFPFRQTNYPRKQGRDTDYYPVTRQKISENAKPVIQEGKSEEHRSKKKSLQKK